MSHACPEVSNASSCQCYEQVVEKVSDSLRRRSWRLGSPRTVQASLYVMCCHLISHGSHGFSLLWVKEIRYMHPPLVSSDALSSRPNGPSIGHLMLSLDNWEISISKK